MSIIFSDKRTLSLNVNTDEHVVYPCSKPTVLQSRLIQKRFASTLICFVQNKLLVLAYLSTCISGRLCLGGHSSLHLYRKSNVLTVKISYGVHMMFQRSKSSNALQINDNFRLFVFFLIWYTQ